MPVLGFGAPPLGNLLEPIPAPMLSHPILDAFSPTCGEAPLPLDEESGPWA